MKISQVLIALFFPLCVLAQEVNADRLTKKNGLFYEHNKDVAFTGYAVTYHDNGKKETSTQYKDGEIKGDIRMWYASGTKQVEGELIKGKKTGKWIAWYENGNKLRQGAFKNDKEEGKYTWWFENGKINKKGTYHDGLSDGKWKWYYESGQIKQQGTIKDKTNEGTWKDWHENGKQKMIGNFKDGVKEGTWTWWDEQGNVTTKKEYKKGFLMGDANDLDSHIERMEYYMNERDFKNALNSVEKALATLDNKTENNKIYMGLEIYHSKVYSFFEHLDEAEAVLLKSLGLAEPDMNTLVTSNYEPPVETLNTLVNKLSEAPETKTRVGTHIVIAYIYNILGDTVNLKKEQQLMWELSDKSDWVVKTSLALYKVRARKEEAHGQLQFEKAEIEKNGETKKNQVKLGFLLYKTGQFNEAGKIADKYLATDPKDIDCLFLKTNVEMALGNFEKMKALEKEILIIDPKAFEKQK